MQTDTVVKFLPVGFDCHTLVRTKRIYTVQPGGHRVNVNDRIGGRPPLPERKQTPVVNTVLRTPSVPYQHLAALGGGYTIEQVNRTAFTTVSVLLFV